MKQRQAICYNVFMRLVINPPIETVRLEDIFVALSDTVRLGVVLVLANTEEVTSGFLRPDLPKSTLTHHFKVLRESGLVRTRMEGTQRFLSLRRAEMERRFPGLIEPILAALRANPPETGGA